MIVKSLISFCGAVSMAKGDVKEIDDALARDLLGIGYVEEIRRKTNERNSNKHPAHDANGDGRTHLSD